MERIEMNLQTGESVSITLSPAEEAVAMAKNAAWNAENTQDLRAAKAVDGIDRLQFEHLFDLENRTRAMEGLAQITRNQYRQALINRWKTLHS